MLNNKLLKLDSYLEIIEKAFWKTLIKILPKVITFFFLLYVYMWIYNAYGIERTIISLLIIIMLKTGSNETRISK